MYSYDRTAVSRRELLKAGDVALRKGLKQLKDVTKTLENMPTLSADQHGDLDEAVDKVRKAMDEVRYSYSR